MQRQFIPDKEKSLSPENDFLKTGVYANTLKKIIDNSPKNEIFTIGLFGNWGTGKSSVIETAKEKFNQSKVKFITYDAWKYVNDSFRRMFLLKVQEELKLDQTSEMGRFYQSENAEVKQRQIFTLRGMMVLFLLAIAVAIVVAVLPIDWSVKTPIISIVPLLALLVTVINGFFYNLKISVSKPALFAPEQFENCFKQMMETSLKKESYLVRAVRNVVDYVRRGETSVSNLDKVVIVIDNIDRCHNAMAYQLLTDIKTFLSNENYNVVFIIPVDDEALKKHLFGNSNATEGQSEEFLRKFFNVTLRIKPHQPTEMLSFAHELNKNKSLGFNNDTLSLVAKEFATNPRRIIQLFNNLSSELTLYPEDFATKNEALICAILIIREEFPDFYAKVLDNVNLLNDGYEKELKDNNALLFMRIAEAIFRESNLADILKILTNTSSQFDALPMEVRKSIGVDAPAVVDFISNNREQESTVYGLILDSLGTDGKYKSTTQLANWLDFLSQLHAKLPIERSRLKLLNQRHNNHYEKIIPVTKNAVEICSYAQTLEKVGCHQLKEAILKYLLTDLGKNAKVPGNHNDYINAAFLTFNEEADSKTLASFVEKYYADKWINQKLKYSDAQKKFLFSDTHLKNWIGKLDKIDNGDIVDELQWLMDNKTNISVETYATFFTKIDTLLGTSMQDKPTEVILSYIEFLIPFLSSIASRKLTKEPFAIYEKFFTPWTTTTLDPYRRQVQTTVIPLDEFANDAEALKTLSLFCCEIYRITNNNTAISEQLRVLYPQNKETINEKLISLLNEGFSLVPIFDIILSDNEYSQDNITLTEHCLISRNKDKKRHIDATALKNKIATLVENASNEQVASLLIKVNSVDPEIKAMVVAEIVTKDATFINSLSSKLLELAVEAFNKDTCTAYISNYPYLEIVAEKCSAEQRKVLVSSLLPNIPANKDIDNTLRVLEKITIGTQKERNLIHAQLDSYLETIPKDNAALRERIEALMKKIKVKE